MASLSSEATARLAARAALDKNAEDLVIRMRGHGTKISRAASGR